jgi:hypothetical protein
LQYVWFLSLDVIDFNTPRGKVRQAADKLHGAPFDLAGTANGAALSCFRSVG